MGSISRSVSAVDGVSHKDHKEENQETQEELKQRLVSKIENLNKRLNQAEIEKEKNLSRVLDQKIQEIEDDGKQLIKLRQKLLKHQESFVVLQKIRS